MFQFIFDILKELIPDRNQPTIHWVARFLVLSFVLGTFGYFVWNAVLTTTLSERFNVRPINTKLPMLTHAELIITNRQVWREIAELRIADDNVRAAFLMVLIDKKTRNITLDISPAPDKTEVWIWNFEIPVRRFSSIEVIEDVANNLQDDLEPKLRESQKCMTAEISGETLATLKRAIPEFISTHASICPIYTFYNPRLIGATMIFFRPIPPLVPWHYEERLRLANIQASTFFRDFTAHYEMIYE